LLGSTQKCSLPAVSFGVFSLDLLLAELLAQWRKTKKTTKNAKQIRQP